MSFKKAVTTEVNMRRFEGKNDIFKENRMGNDSQIMWNLGFNNIHK